jgi:hypothetical protein
MSLSTEIGQTTLSFPGSKPEVVSNSRQLKFVWPGWPHVRHYLALWAAVTIEFVIIFFGGDFVTAHRRARLHAFLPFELSIPLVPSMVIAYMSIYLIWIPAPFLLRERHQVNRLAFALALVILIAGIGFLAFPAELGFPPMSEDLARLDPGSANRWGAWLRLADLLNLDYDLIPSLHIAMFVTTAGAYAYQCGRVGRVVLGLWATAVVASTVLTHQHHLIDAIAGLALGLAGARIAGCEPRGTLATDVHAHSTRDRW